MIVISVTPFVLRQTPAMGLGTGPSSSPTFLMSATCRSMQTTYRAKQSLVETGACRAWLGLRLQHQNSSLAWPGSSTKLKRACVILQDFPKPGKRQTWSVPSLDRICRGLCHTIKNNTTHIEGVLGGPIQCNLLYLRRLLVTLVIYHKDIERVDALAPPMEGQAQHMQLGMHATSAQPSRWLQARTWNFTYLQAGTAHVIVATCVCSPHGSQSGRDDVGRKTMHYRMVMPQAYRGRCAPRRALATLCLTSTAQAPLRGASAQAQTPALPAHFLPQKSRCWVC